MSSFSIDFISLTVNVLVFKFKSFVDISKVRYNFIGLKFTNSFCFLLKKQLTKFRERTFRKLCHISLDTFVLICRNANWLRSIIFSKKTFISSFTTKMYCLDISAFVIITSCKPSYGKVRFLVMFVCLLGPVWPLWTCSSLFTCGAPSSKALAGLRLA